MPEPDEKRGLYRKWIAIRTDGSSAPGCEHDDCVVFVLDLKHDKFARGALAAYRLACEKEFPALAQDIEVILQSGYSSHTAQDLMDDKEP